MWVALRLDSESVALLLVFRGRREGSPHAPDGSAQLCPALPGAGAARPGQPSPAGGRTRGRAGPASGDQGEEAHGHGARPALPSEGSRSLSPLRTARESHSPGPGGLAPEVPVLRGRGQRGRPEPRQAGPSSPTHGSVHTAGAPAPSGQGAASLPWPGPESEQGGLDDGPAPRPGRSRLPPLPRGPPGAPRGDCTATRPSARPQAAELGWRARGLLSGGLGGLGRAAWAPVPRTRSAWLRPSCTAAVLRHFGKGGDDAPMSP